MSNDLADNVQRTAIALRAASDELPGSVSELTEQIETQSNRVELAGDEMAAFSGADRSTGPNAQGEVAYSGPVVGQE